MKKILFIPIFITFIVFIGCDDEINPNLDSPIGALVIDAFLNNRDTPQYITITRSHGYFDTKDWEKISGAKVVMTDNNDKKFEFIEQNGVYVWKGTAEETIGNEGNSFTLEVTYDGETFYATSKLNRTTVIDSMAIKYRIFTAGRNRGSNKKGYFFLDLLTKEAEGLGDTYWIKSWVNTELLNLPNEIAVAYDAAFSNVGVDGIKFIPPVQNRFTPFRTEKDEKGNFLYQKVGYDVNDSITLEIHSITHETFYYLSQFQQQSDRQGGFGALFAAPLSNINTNFRPTQNDSKYSVYGFFNTAIISSKSLTVTQEMLDEAFKDPIK